MAKGSTRFSLNGLLLLACLCAGGLPAGWLRTAAGAVCPGKFWLCQFEKKWARWCGWKHFGLNRSITSCAQCGSNKSQHGTLIAMGCFCTVVVLESPEKSKRHEEDVKSWATNQQSKSSSWLLVVGCWLFGHWSLVIGLIMHVGVDGGKLKTEAWHATHHCQKKNEARGAEEATFAVDEGHITFFCKFKCLESLLTQDLKDNNGVGRRINQATAQVQSLTNTWMSKDITT
jgi:hypothetical protein